MTLTDALWMVAGYLAGTFPSTWLVSRMAGEPQVLRAARRDAGEADAHILVGARAGAGWGVLAGVLDVSKGIAFCLAARRWGGLGEPWVAMAGVALVVGHAFPFYLRGTAGRGLAGAAGVYLALLPVPMILAGLTMCAGFAVRQSGLFSTLGFGSVPVAAALLGQPGPFVAMSVAIFVLILIRRIEGVTRVTRETGLSRLRAAWYRAVYDSSGPPAADGVAEPGEERTQA